VIPCSFVLKIYVCYLSKKGARFLDVGCMLVVQLMFLIFFFPQINDKAFTILSNKVLACHIP